MEVAELKDVTEGAVVAILAQPAVRATVDANKANRLRFEPNSRARLLPFMDVPPTGK
jgi:hypothetical protein